MDQATAWRLLGGSSQRIHFFSQLALQVCCLIFVNNAFFSQLVDHRSYFRQLFPCFLLPLDRSQITDRVTGGFTVVTVTISALFSLPYIFFGCLMICH